jgi:lipid II:glycine glycyltransferase (peptidoglycan interpeptide bridge formation enzyme)
MIEIVDSIDKRKWSDFVSKHPQGNIFQTPEMAEVFSNSKNYFPFFLALVEGSETKGVILSSLIKESSLFGILSSRSIIQGGPLLAEEVSKDEAIQFLQEYNKRISSQAMFTQFRLLSDFSNEDIFHESGFQQEERLNFLIDISRSIDETWSSIPKSRRKNIKRSDKLGVEIEEMKTEEYLSVFYNLIKDTYNRVRLPVADTSLFEAAFHLLQRKKMAKFYLARYQGKPIASRVVLIYNGLVYDWYAGTSNDHMDLYANEALVWKVLQDAAEDGFHTFDFGGAGRPGENAGRYVFKKRFGGKGVMVKRYVKVHSPIKMRVAKAGYKVYRKIRA